jgi:type I restriction enzyme S subunit
MKKVKCNNRKAKESETKIPSSNSLLNTQNSPLPKGWVWVRLGEIAEIISGVSFKPNQLCKQDVKSVRILRGGNIQNDNYYLLEDDYFVPKDIVSNDQLLRRYDIILVSSTGSKQAIGKAAIIKEKLNNLSVGAFLRIIRIYENIQKKYIGFYFYTLSYRNYIREIVKGVNINNIKDSYLNEMFLPLPPLPEQQRIVEEIERRFSVADEVEKVIDNSLKQAERLRQSILKKAFEGKLVPQDPSDEPAEKLLERIKAEKENNEKRNRKS